MTLLLSDWLVVALYFIVSAAIGLAYTRKASRSLEDYFVSGRALPWWLAGTSMVATTFAADTPLAVAGLVAQPDQAPGRQLLQAHAHVRAADPEPVGDLVGGQRLGRDEQHRVDLPDCAVDAPAAAHFAEMQDEALGEGW